MIDKLYIIKQILETDEDTDIKILSILDLANENPDKENIHLIEERVAKRKKIMIEVSLNTEKEKILAETEDISSTGAFIRTKKKIGKGEHISIKLTDPSGEEFTFVAKVMRVKSHGIGVMVKNIGLSHQDNLSKFLDRL
ncbi:MAG: PilZ domain-containing protein [Proteobacteria bacterium]|nr:PilZ domain-containing protein [Pseudomonadota bacterium]MBU1698053.1 PilZ domain-containing protein [Pseudomonadota bacterium]